MGRMLSFEPRRAAPQKIAKTVNLSGKSNLSVAEPPVPARRPAVTPQGGFAFWAGLSVIFVRMAVIPEILSYVTGQNTYILYILGPIAILGMLVNGGFQRVFSVKAVWWWTAFCVLMMLATPFSYWPGGSAQLVLSYMRTCYICLLVLGGAVTFWKEIRTVFHSMVACGFVVLLVVRFLCTPDSEGRLSLDVFDSTIGNANDLAIHVMFFLPFLLFFALTRGRNVLLRILALGGASYALWVILGTSSRGAVVGLGAMALFLFFQANARQRIAALILVPVLTLALLAVLPAQNRARLTSLFSSESADQTDHAVATEAAESLQSRTYLFKKSVQYTFEHPLLGVGPGQFGNFEGQASKSVGLHGSWHETHNAYTQISSECGIPALICMLAGLFGAFSLVRKAFKKARALGNVEIARACLCYMTAFIGYMTTSIFLANGYRFMLPALISFAIAIHFASENEFARPRPQFHKSPVPTA